MIAGLLFGLNAALNLALMLALARLMTPEGYGAFATWSAAGVLLVTALFDWVRFAAMRFYTPRVREEEPQTRATLDLAFLLMVPPLALVLAGAAGAGGLPGLEPATAGALALLVVGNAAGEYLTALARNLDARGVYARIIALRQGLGLGIAVPVAAFTRDPALTVAALAFAVWPAVLYGWWRLRDGQAGFRLARRPLAVRFVAYGVPLIAAEAVFQAIGLVNRTWLGLSAGLAVAGAYALTFDLAFKVVAVVASMGEAALLPRLVVGHEAKGKGAPGALVSRNIALMLLLLAPACTGFWVLARPFAEFVLAPEFRPAFLAGLDNALVCAVLYTLQSYVLRPAFQLELRTLPLLQAAVLALAVNIAGLWFFRGQGFDGVVHAHQLGLAFGAALLVGRCVLQLQVRWPLAETARILAAAAAMALAGRAVLSALGPTPLAAPAAGIAMGLAYAGMVVLLDAAGIRRLALERWRARTAPEALAPHGPPAPR